MGHTITKLLLKQGKAVRVMVRNEGERAQALRNIGAEVAVGDLLDLDSMHRVIAGCETMHFCMSISDAYLAATVNVAALAKYHAVKVLINMSQMMLSQMSITETTTSPRHKLHWLADQALNLPCSSICWYLVWRSRGRSVASTPVAQLRPNVSPQHAFVVLARLLSHPEPHCCLKPSVHILVERDLGAFQITAQVALSQLLRQICLGFPHGTVNGPIVILAFVRSVIAAEVDPNEPSAVAACDDLANFASHRDFLLGSQLRHSLRRLPRARGSDSLVD